MMVVNKIRLILKFQWLSKCEQLFIADVMFNVVQKNFKLCYTDFDCEKSKHKLWLEHRNNFFSIDLLHKYKYKEIDSYVT